MISWASLLPLIHVLGLALAVGSSTSKLVLLLRCRSNPDLVSAYIAVARPITRLIILGLALLTISGVALLVIGYGLTTVLVVKIILVAVIWIIGPIIDNVVEPKFRALAPASGASPSPEFLRAQRHYIALEVVASGLFYVIIVMWMML